MIEEMPPSGIYNGRLQCDGEGNLLADQSTKVGEKTITVMDGDEPVLGGDGQAITITVPIFKFGKQHGFPVAAHEGSYVFLAAGDESHNARHHQQFAKSDHGPLGESDFIDGTVDETMTDDETLINVGDESNQHHFHALPDDPHYEEGAKTASGILTHTKAPRDPDAFAATITGHTEAYKGKSE